VFSVFLLVQTSTTPRPSLYFLIFYRVLAGGPPTMTSGFFSDKLCPPGSKLWLRHWWWDL